MERRRIAFTVGVGNGFGGQTWQLSARWENCSIPDADLQDLRRLRLWDPAGPHYSLGVTNVIEAEVLRRFTA